MNSNINSRHFFPFHVFSLLTTFSILISMTAGCADLGVLAGMLTGESRVVLYGLVLDQFEQPVEGAVVLYEVESFSLPFPGYHEGKVKTNKDGCFKISDGRGSRMDILDISLERCEFPLKGRTPEYEYRDDYTDCFKPDKDKPEVFHLRRKEKEAVFLHRKMFALELPAQDKEENWRGLDMCGNVVEPRFKNSREDHLDFEVTWEHNPDKKEWTIHVKALDDYSCFQIRNEKLYMAPEDGYVREQTFTVGYNENLPIKHIYLRLRKPGMYARIDIMDAYVRDYEFAMEGKGYINVYGDRCLEDLEIDLNATNPDIYSQCVQEAREAIRKQELAPRPPFEQWIKEGRATF